MKKHLFFTVMVFFVLTIVKSQDFPDPYNPGEDVTFDDFTSILCGDFTGEYEFFANLFFWYQGDELSFDDKLMKIETVSYPFVPDCYFVSDCFDNSTTERNFISKNLNDLGDIVYSAGNSNEVIGKGWGDIFFNTEKHAWETTDYTLSSSEYLINNSGKLGLPHSILKYTFYIWKNKPGLDYTLVDSLSWVIDNTRGRMNWYPFHNINENQEGNKADYDLTIIPKIRYDNLFGHDYYETSNSSWYNGPSNGSIDYYPTSDIAEHEYTVWVHPLDSQYPINNGIYSPTDNFYTHPPSYSLMYCPVRNCRGDALAGYGSGGLPIPPDFIGIEHTYTINETMDLSLINPSEKIIYNPSSMTIDCELTFPQGYKFLSVHGKPPDKQDVIAQRKAWAKNPGKYFYDLRDVPMPSDQGFSTFILGPNAKIIIEPCVWLMDITFVAHENSEIHYDPHNTFGNAVEFIDGCGAQIHYIKNPFKCYKPPGQTKSTEKNDLPIKNEDNITISPNPTSGILNISLNNIDNIDVNVNINNSLGRSIFRKNFNTEKITIDLSEYPEGIYYVVINQQDKNYTKKVILK